MKHTSSTAELTIAELLRRMRPAQLYGVCGALAAMIAGAFALGLYVSSYRAERAQFEATTTSDELKRLALSQEFYTRFLRYAITKKQFEDNRYMYDGEHTKARALFVALVKTWYSDQGKVGTQFVLTPVFHKSYDPAQSSVTLPDGSSWPIPYEVKKEVLGLP